MSTASADVTGVSSHESVSAKKGVFPFELRPLPHLSSDGERPVLESLARLDPSQPEPTLSLDAICNLQEELRILRQKTEENLKTLDGRSGKLGSWIKEVFEVEDPLMWLEQQRKAEQDFGEKASTSSASAQHPVSRHPSRSLSITIPVIDEADARPKGQSSHKPSTMLRLKLNEPPQSPSPPASASASTVQRRGSKNLSRMNRPADSSAASSAEKPKIPNQVPITVFWNYTEPYFRPIDEADLKLLDDPSAVIDPVPFTIPPVGKPYEEQWREMYGYGGPNILNESQKRRVLSEARPSLRDRLFSLLLEKDDLGEIDALETFVQYDQELPSISNEGESMVALDFRLRQELRDIGIPEFATVAHDHCEDDPISIELRSLQKQLREQTCVNMVRKKRLAELVKSKLPGQEFYALLGELDGQLEQIYQRKMKAVRKKKKVADLATCTTASTSTATGTSTPISMTPEPTTVLDNRNRLVSAFKTIIPSRLECLLPNPEPIVDEQAEAIVLKQVEAAGGWLPLPELPLHQSLSTNLPGFPTMPL